MARCKGCIHDKVCNRDVGHGYSICPYYINAADVAPKSEVERLKAEKDNLIKTYKECMVEAIKEFAEKLGSYEEVVTTLKDGENIVAIDVHHLHRLVKEMTGENNQ